MSYDVGILVGSVYGNAQRTAESAKVLLWQHGVSTRLFMAPNLEDIERAKNLLVITSTTGRGEVPPNLARFVLMLRHISPLLHGKPFAVVCLGDSRYGDSYCGAGRQIFALLEALEGHAIADLLEVDVCETLPPETRVMRWISQHILGTKREG